MSGRDPTDLANNPTAALETRGVIGEIAESLQTPFETDEYRRTELRLLGAILTEVMDDTVAGPPAVGGGSNVSIGSPSGVAQMPVPGSTFEHAESDDVLTLSPGESDTIVEAEVQEAALWWEVGTTDNDNSRYSYAAGDADLLEDPTLEPLGLFNDPYRFPQPIISRGNITVDAARDSSATGDKNYVSKVRYVPISTDTASTLADAWGQL